MILFLSKGTFWWLGLQHVNVRGGGTMHSSTHNVIYGGFWLSTSGWWKRKRAQRRNIHFLITMALKWLRIFSLHIPLVRASHMTPADYRGLEKCSPWLSSNWAKWLQTLVCTPEPSHLPRKRHLCVPFLPVLLSMTIIGHWKRFPEYPSFKIPFCHGLECFSISGPSIYIQMSA